MNEEFNFTKLIEQESIINLNYKEKCLYLYASRKSVYNRFLEKLGEPDRKSYAKNKKISGASWKIPFDDKKKINIALSRPLLIGNIGKKSILPTQN